MFCKITALIFFLLGAAGSWVWLDYQNASTKAAIIQKPVHIEIKKGESFNRITQKLRKTALPISEHPELPREIFTVNPVRPDNTRQEHRNS